MIDDPQGAAPEDADLAALLAIERARTATQIAALSRDFDEIVAGSEDANLDDEHDPEGATIGFERAQVIALLSQARAQLAELDEAADRLGRGTFGLCERCGNRIPVERLLALPSARVCVSCAPTTRRA